jgi:hypothetical protein
MQKGGGEVLRMTVNYAEGGRGGTEIECQLCGRGEGRYLE